MRILTKEQKDLLDRAMDEDFAVTSYDDLTESQMDSLDDLNDCELNCQNATRYITDRRMNEVHRGL